MGTANEQTVGERRESPMFESIAREGSHPRAAIVAGIFLAMAVGSAATAVAIEIAVAAGNREARAACVPAPGPFEMARRSE